jgi:pimeloyl-ACP methyl ester carboxylesterase
MSRKTLLACGFTASLLYIAMDIFVPMWWPAYSSFSQTISELSAIDAPTRPLWVPLGVIYTLLVALFGVGIWQSAQRNRRLRVVGGLFVASGLIGLGWLPMHQREVLAAGGGTLTDTMHLLWSVITVSLMMVEMGFAAAAFGRRFRSYTVVTMVVLFVFGALTFRSAPGVAANLPTPWLGVWERINVLGFMVWQAVLALALRSEAAQSKVIDVERMPSPFKTPEGQAAYLAEYDAAMKAWPVPYREVDIPTRFGTTHVIVSGPIDAAPLVLLHGYWATLTMWAANVADFSSDYRVYAIDVMGQPSKTVPTDPIRNAQDYVAWLTETLDALHLARVSLVGMSFGGWLALKFALAAPDRLLKLVLLSPGGFLPMVRQFSLRGMLMLFLPSRLTVNTFMRWLGFRAGDGNVLELMYLGLKHFRIPLETAQITSTALSDDELRSLHVPTLLLFGEREVIYDPAAALARARRLVPDLEGELVSESRHDMCVRQRAIVDARVLDFLEETRSAVPERVVA